MQSRRTVPGQIVASGAAAAAVSEHFHLEGDIGDVADMALVVDVLLERFEQEIGHLNNPIFQEVARKRMVEHIEREGRPFLFAVHHLCVMARSLKEHYYAELEQKVD